MNIKITKKEKSLNGNIHLVGSKSESNRVLIIRELCGKNFKIDKLSTSDDTKILQKSINVIKKSASTSLPITIDIGDTGTAMRFLTAFLAVQQGSYLLTGNERMQNRPIGILVNALRKLGADIEYLKRDGFPPILIKGKALDKSEVEISGTVSSQFISSLLLVAPSLPKGLCINLSGQIVSLPYIKMTLKIMEHFGVKHSWKANKIYVPPQKYKPVNFIVGADWSAASYWYEMAAFSDTVDLYIEGLNDQYLQGDAVAVNIFEHFGVNTSFEEAGIRLSKTKKSISPFAHDFIDCPDLAQTLAVTCAGLNVPGDLYGLHNLSIKETDRLRAMETELRRLGYHAGIVGNSRLFIHKATSPANIKNIVVKTYNDHRMAMAFAPLAIVNGQQKIGNPEVVSKSYPDFWNDIKTVNFSVEDIC